MINYINKSVYLSKMVPLNWGCRGVWGVLGIGGVWGYYGTIEMKRKAPLYGMILTKCTCMCPINVRGGFGPCREVGNLGYLRWSAGVSCRT